MVNIDSTVSIPVKIPFVSVNNTTGMSAFSNVHLLKDGVLNPLATTFTEIGNGLYVATFTPTSTGLYTYFIEGKIQATIRVVGKTIYTLLQNIEDSAIGSWQWDKTTGILTLIRQDGTTLAGFSVIDNLTAASRERTSP